MECFFEAQASVTEDLKKSIGKRAWRIVIDDGKTPYEVSHNKYFMEKFIDAGIKLIILIVYTNVLSEVEKNLLIKCSTNFRYVFFYLPLNIGGWSPKHKIESVVIDSSLTYVSKNEFKGFLLPWIRLTGELTFSSDFSNIEELKKFK